MMFSSNQEFVITGDLAFIEKQLKAAIDLAMHGFGFVPVAFSVSNDGKMIFYDYVPILEMQDKIPIREQNRTVTFVCKIMELQTMSYEFKNALTQLPKDETDGSYESGWKLTLDNSQIGDRLVLEPFWVFYHK